MSTVYAMAFAGLVFVVVLLLSSAFIIPTVSSSARASRKMRKRMQSTLSPGEDDLSLFRENYTDTNKSSESTLSGAVASRIEQKIRHAGLKVGVKKIVLMSLCCFAICWVVVFILSQFWLLASFFAVISSLFPYYRLCVLARKRIDLFEQQLPEALDVMSRALKVGHPFNETLNFVGEEMDNPIAEEFSRVFSDINYGQPSKAAFHSLLERVPSVSLQTLVTAVLIQQESGGALAEILEKVADVIRGRFRLQRKLKSLSAEGRMSAWVLTMIPFGLAGMLMVVSPDYLPILFSDELGRKIIACGVALLCIGALWIKYIINIKV